MRLARYLGRCGVASHPKAEALVRGGHIRLNGQIVTDPARPVGPEDRVALNGTIVQEKPVRLWSYHKPPGELVSHADPFERRLIFHSMPSWMHATHFIGRLDYLSEGLVLLTNSPVLKHLLETSPLPRVYRVRVYGRLSAQRWARLHQEAARGLTLEGITYAPIDIQTLHQREKKTWLQCVLTEGKNQEIRRVMRAFDLTVNQLVRVRFGPFALAGMRPRERRALAIANVPADVRKALSRDAYKVCNGETRKEKMTSQLQKQTRIRATSEKASQDAVSSSPGRP